ncbi:MAG: LysR family transcriptional regulator [Hyphomicrobiaceae bacterium]
MDRLEEMRTFVVVAEAGVTGAAARLRLAPSAVSRRLKDLETRLGADLLLRTTRRMELTDAGRQFLSDCHRILDEVTTAEARVGDVHSAPAGLIRIAAPLSFGITELQPALNVFMTQYPDVRIDLDLDDRRVDIQREGYDLAIRIGTLEDSSLTARKLAAFRMIAAASPAFLEEHGAPESIADFSDLPALCYSVPARPEVWTCRDAAGRRRSATVRARMLSSNGDVLRDAAISGLGVVVQPEFIVGRAIADRRLKRILEDHDWFEVEAFALWPARQYLPHRVRNLIDHLIDEWSGGKRDTT